MIIEQVNEILADEAANMTGYTDTGDGFRKVDKQVNLIIAISKELKMKRGKLFNYILKSFQNEAPALSTRLTDKEKKYYNTSAVFQLLDASQKSLLIKRLKLTKQKYAAKKD